MYKVFINDSSLSFINSSSPSSKECLQYFPEFDFETLIAGLESSKGKRHVDISSNLPDLAWEEFKKIFKIVEAAGGIVKNSEGKILLIYRLGFWDLPKGKIELGEEKSEAAMREVEEECGIKHLKLEEDLPNTYHIYSLKGIRILKPTYWYEMSTSFSGELIPQLEEDIVEAKWVSKEELQSYISKTYSSIAGLLQYFLGSKH